MRIKQLNEIKRQCKKDHELHDPAYINTVSSTSTWVSDIKGMVFGGF